MSVEAKAPYSIAPPPFIYSGWRKLLSVLEILFSCLIVLFMAYRQLFVVAMSNCDTPYEHPIGAQAYLGPGCLLRYECLRRYACSSCLMMLLPYLSLYVVLTLSAGD